MATIISLFDTSLAWSEPYHKRGFNIFEIDLNNFPSINILDITYTWIVENILENINDDIVGVIAAPPCTDFTVSGNTWWKIKDLDGRTYKSCLLVSAALEIINVVKPNFWVIENPVGRLPKLFPQLGKPFYFDPCDYAGYYMSEEEKEEADRLRAIGASEQYHLFTAKDIAFIKQHNIYTKKTGLWGDFTPPVKNRIEPIRTCKQGSWLQSLGGKSEKTKRLRSVTPSYFAERFFQCNNDDSLQDDDFYDFYFVDSSFSLDTLEAKPTSNQLELFN